LHRLSRKIWVAVSTPFQANFFYPLIRRLEDRFDFLVTARNHDRIFSILDAKKIPYIPIGRHGGERLEGKLRAYAENIQQLIPIVKEEKPSLLLTERWPEAVRVAFGLNIPAWTLYYDEREYHVNRMVFPLSSKVFAPSFYTATELQRNGVDPEKVVWFDGFHTCYLKDEKVRQEQAAPHSRSGSRPPTILVRPEPEFASFFGEKQDILERTIHLLTSNKEVKNDLNIVILPRTKQQAIRYAQYPVTVMVDALPENPVAYADVVVGAAETMLMEAFVLGKPVVSTVYWRESKPLSELHKYVFHTNDPKLAAYKCLEYLDPEVRREFYQRAMLITSLMENPILKFEREINRFYAEPGSGGRKTSKRRSQIEVFMDILESVAFRPLKLTHIMKAANLSYTRASRDLLWLRRKGFIEECTDQRAGRCFRATAKGLRLLADYRRVVHEILS